MRMTRTLFVLALTLGVMTTSAFAEIYKWKDKDGVTRYTDTPPPNGVKSLSTIGRKAAKPSVPASAEVEAAKANTNDMAQTTPKIDDNSPTALAEKRRQLAETEKKNKAEKEAEQKRRELNCNTAKANFQTYSQGGRIYKTNAQGEREYLGDDDLKNGVTQAQKEMQENCR